MNLLHLTILLACSTLALTLRGGGFHNYLVGEAEMSALNEHYRGIPRATNVLSFAAELPAEHLREKRAGLR